MRGTSPLCAMIVRFLNWLEFFGDGRIEFAPFDAFEGMLVIKGIGSGEVEGQGAERPPALMPLTGGETILLVEDEARVRKLIVDVLSGRGYRVLEATRGEEALRICQAHCAEIDLAVVDVVMPEMNGPELMRRIQPICPRVRVLYISG